MQKKAMLVIVLLAFLLIGPVLAAPKDKKQKPEKTTFTNRVIIVAGGSSPGEQRTTEMGILYVKDAISTGYIEADPNSPMSGSVLAVLSGSVDLNTMLGSFNGKWTITNERGTFEGSVVGIIEIANVSGRFVGSGTGDSERYCIRGSFEGTVNDYIVDVTLHGILISKSYCINIQIPSEIRGE